VHSTDPATLFVPVCDPSGEHLLVDRRGMVVRFDIIEGSVSASSVSLHFDVPCDDLWM
jgi:hypothetical protein